jgi:hypothetical protein
MSPLFAVYCCCLLLPVCVVCGGCVCVVCVCDPGPRSGRWSLVAGRWSLVLGRTPWPPREISGGGATGPRPGPDLSGHNEGASKCAGARARPAPSAQSPVRRNPNPQTTEHEAHESGSRSSQSRLPIQQAIRGPAGLRRLCPKSVSQLRI